jgi:hypothetical protein
MIGEGRPVTALIAPTRVRHCRNRGAKIILPYELNMNFLRFRMNK